MRGNFTNFATTNLAGGAGGSGFNMTTSDMSFSVSPGAGSTFPSVTSTLRDNFLVAIDSEIMLCSARATDTITVVARGYEGTTVSAHSVGAVVVAGATAGALMEFWKALADTYNPDVPPWARGGAAPAGVDDEFEIAASNAGTFGNWTFTPNDGGQYHSANYDYRSQFYFRRYASSTTTYWLWQPFAPGGGTKFTVTAKISHSTSLDTGAGGIQATMFVADVANPSVSLDGGNRALLMSAYGPSLISYADESFGVYHSGQINVHSAILGLDSSGTFIPAHPANGRLGGAYATALTNGYTYFSLSYDGAFGWWGWIGDGYTYQAVGNFALFMTPQSMGFRFYSPNNSISTATQETCMIDWVRVNVGRARQLDADAPLVS